MAKKQINQSKSIDLEAHKYLFNRNYKIYPTQKSKSWVIEIDIFGFKFQEEKYILSSDIQSELAVIYSREYELYFNVIELDKQLINNDVYVFYTKLESGEFQVIIKNTKTGEVKKISNLVKERKDLKNAIEKTIEFYYNKLIK